MNSFIKKIILALSIIFVYASVFADDRKTASDLNGTTVQISDDGATILYSRADNLTWKPANGLTGEYHFNSVIYAVLKSGGGIFVAVGNHGTIVFSDDGEHWFLAQGFTGGNADLMSVVQGECDGRDRFVAVGNHGTIVFSDDGKSWVQAKFQTLHNILFTSVTYEASNFVAFVGGSLMYSSYSSHSVANYPVGFSQNGTDWQYLNKYVELESKNE